MKFDINEIPDPPRSRDFYSQLSDEQRQFMVDAWHAYKTGKYTGSIVNLARFVKDKADIPIGYNYLKDWMSLNDDLLSK